MPRSKRADEAGAIYHAWNRGNARQKLFFKDEDFEAFERVIIQGLEKFEVDLIAYQWMPNHWHMVLSPRVDGAMAAFVGWITLTHTQRFHAHHQSAGQGHVYQGRYKSFPVQDDGHFHTVCRYVERNALTAGLVKRAEDYRWGSLYNWVTGASPIPLAIWPVKRLTRWAERVNTPMTPKELKQVRNCVERGLPLGTPEWTDATVKRLGLESAQRPRGRPRKIT